MLGPVFRTYEPDRDRLVSVKLIRLDLLPEQASSLAEALQGLVEIGLEHSSIVTPIAAGLEGHKVYFAEEYVAGESLDIALRHYAPAPLETALPYLAQLAGAIDYARARGVGHGALHPRDIFLTPDRARATGFGITQALERVGVRPPVRRPYSAPERVAGQSWSTPADVFALGAVAHELLTGKRPAGTGEVAPIAGKAAESHPELLRAVLARALADEPVVRYPSASALVSALEAAACGEGEEPSTASLRHAQGVPSPSKDSGRPEPVELREPAPRELAVELDAEAASAETRLESAEEPTFEIERGEPAAPDRTGRAAPEASLFDLMPADGAPPGPRPEPERELELVREPEAEPAREEPEPEIEVPGIQEPPPGRERPPVVERLKPVAFTAEAEPASEPLAGPDFGRPEPVQQPASPAILPLAIVGIVAMLGGFLAGYLVGSREHATPPAAMAQPPAAGRESPAPQPPVAQPPAASLQPRAAQPPAASLRPSTRSGRPEPVEGQPPTASREWSEAKVEPSPAPAPAVKAPVPPAASRESPPASRQLPAAGREKPPAGRQPATASPQPPTGTGSLLFESRPPGARVVLDGRAIGKTPFKLRNVKAGPHTVRLEIDGYRTWSTEITVAAGRETRVAGSLERTRNP